MELDLPLFVSYLTDTKKASQSTVNSYCRDLKKLEHYLSGQGVLCAEQVTAEDLNAYIAFLEEQGMSCATISRNVASMKALFHYLFYRKKLDADPTESVKAPHTDRRFPEILSQEEVERLLEQPVADSPKGRRDKAMLELLYGTGMRVSELVTLKLSEVRIGQSFLICCDADRERAIPFGVSARTALEDYLENGRERLLKGTESEYLFVNCSGGVMSRQGFWKLLKQYAHRAGIYMEITPRTLRHSFAAHLVQNGADLKAVQEMMGHSDISSTQMYVNMNLARVQKEYNHAHPRR